ALLFLLGASVLLPLTWRDRVRVGSRRKITRRGPIARTVTNPFYHLARHGQASPALVWSLLLAMVGLSVGLAIHGTPASGGGRRSGFLLSFVTAFAAHQLIKYIIASEAGRRFSEDRRSGALEVLLVSPMRPQIMIAGQRLALWHLCRGPLALLAVLNLFLLANFLSAWPFGGGPSVTWSLGIVGGIVLLAADYYALSWTGMWHGLTSSRHHRAVLATLARVMLPPWLAAFFIVFGIGVGGMGIEDVLACWFAVSVITSVIGGHLAQDRLRNEFRKVARDGFQASPRPWNFSFRSRRMPKPSAEQESAA
ncbi:MAG: hypothetical protein L0Y58_08345, partial [Verrucomicrobia subdivision 3 bacterium]|nr:hypothetical protein [Limisphaerales bacterium]